MGADFDPVAIHESGHAYAAWRCGRACGPVTIRPGRRWAGLAYAGPVTIDRRAWARLDASLPYPLWPAAVRRKCDVLALTWAAGEAAEEVLYYMPGRSRRGGGVLAQAAELAAAMPPSRADEVRLAVGRADTTGQSDGERLAALVRAMWPDEAAELRVQWLAYVGAEARHMIAAGAGTVERLASVLAERGTLSGRAVRAILAEP